MLLDPLLASTEPLDDSSHAAARRVDILDNAKAVLIVCVVLYHTAVVYTSADRPEVTCRTLHTSVLAVSRRRRCVLQ
jgi:hypothetical protein